MRREIRGEIRREIRGEIKREIRREMRLTTSSALVNHRSADLALVLYCFYVRHIFWSLDTTTTYLHSFIFNMFNIYLTQFNISLTQFNIYLITPHVSSDHEKES